MLGSRATLLALVLALGCSGPPAEPIASSPPPIAPLPPVPPPSTPEPEREAPEPVEPAAPTPPTGLVPVVPVVPIAPSRAVHVDRELHLLGPEMPACIEMVSACDSSGSCTSSPVEIYCGQITRVGRENLRCNCP